MSQLKDAGKILLFCGAMSAGILIYAAFAHRNDLAAAWIDKSYFASFGAISAFYLGPRRSLRKRSAKAADKESLTAAE